MKVNLKKIGAIVAGATILASSVAFAGLMFGSTTLVDSNGAPVAKVVLGGKATASDGVAAGLIASTLASAAYKSQTLTASVSGTATCSGGGNATGTCAISNEKAKLEITVPGSAAAGTWTGNNLIGDWIHRELLDREVEDTTDTDSAYLLSTSDTSDSANPFTDGAGADIGSSEVAFYRISGTQFSPFADKTVTDDDAGNTYVEKQNLWFSGDNKYDSSDANDIVGTVDFVAYSIKFDGPAGNNFGIPACTEAEDSYYGDCFDTDGDTTIDDATETHRVKIWFLGEEWVISDMNVDDCVGLVADEIEVDNCGSIKLAKESVSGILNQGESLPVGNLKFQLDDLEAHGDDTSAIFSVLDANGNVLKKDKVDPAQTKEFNVGGSTFRLHVYKVAPGYTFGAKWADVAIFSNELELVDAEELDQDAGTNEGYKVALGWKNIDGSATADDADALRTIIVYSESMDDITSSGSETLEEGDYVSIVSNPEVWRLSYKGLSLTSNDTETLTFTLKTSATKKIADDVGPEISDNQQACWIYAPYMEVTTTDSGSVFSMTDDNGAEVSDDSFFVALNHYARVNVLATTDAAPQTYDATLASAHIAGATCDADTSGVGDGIIALDDTDYRAGTVFMKVSQSSDNWAMKSYALEAAGGTDTGISINYEDIGDGDTGFESPEGGVIHIETNTHVDFGMVALTGGLEDRIGNLLASTYGTGGTLSNGESVLIAIAEKAGEGTSSEYVDYFIFGVDDIDAATPSDATFDYASDTGTAAEVITSDDEEILYGHATPVGGVADIDATGDSEFYDTALEGPVDTGLGMVEEGYISERGSKFKSLDDKKIEFDMAHKLGKAQWFLAASSTSAASSSKTVVTLAEGQSETVNGVTVKVLEITETVGACSAGTGSVSCTADMSGVSAVIMPNNAASVSVAVPYSGSYGNLVVLDSEAQNVNTLISVGGDKVNTVTANLLQGGTTDWTATPKLVKEVVQGSKIVVAGKEASDTLAAAQDFVSQVKKV